MAATVPILVIAHGPFAGSRVVPGPGNKGVSAFHERSAAWGVRIDEARMSLDDCSVFEVTRALGWALEAPDLARLRANAGLLAARLSEHQPGAVLSSDSLFAGSSPRPYVPARAETPCELATGAAFRKLHACIADGQDEVEVLEWLLRASEHRRAAGGLLQLSTPHRPGAWFWHPQLDVPDTVRAAREDVLAGRRSRLELSDPVDHGRRLTMVLRVVTSRDAAMATNALSALPRGMVVGELDDAQLVERFRDRCGELLVTFLDEALVGTNLSWLAAAADNSTPVGASLMREIGKRASVRGAPRWVLATLKARTPT